MRYAIASFTVALVALGIFVLSTFIFRPYPRYYAAVFQEFSSPTADQGFKGLGYGISEKQGFYWDEIASSKSLEIEALKEMGKGTNYPYILPFLCTEKFIEAEGLRSVNGFFLVLNYSEVDSIEHVRALQMDAVSEYGAFQRAFTRLVRDRGATITQISEPKFIWVDRLLVRDRLLMDAIPILASAFLAAIVATWILRYRTRRLTKRTD